MAKQKDSFKKARDKINLRKNMHGVMLWIADKVASINTPLNQTRAAAVLGYTLAMWLVMSTYGGGASYDSVNDKNPVELMPVNKDARGITSDYSVAKGFFEKMVLDPNGTDKQWNDAIDAIQPYVIAQTFLHEEFIDHLYSDNGARGTVTLGAGFTVKNKQNRQFVESVIGRKVTNGMRISVQEARRLADEVFRQRIYPKMRTAFNVPIPARTFIALAIAAYNAGDSQYTVASNRGYAVVQAVNNGADTQQIMDVLVQQFAKKRGTRWGGIPNKYAVLAMFAMNDISNETILNSVAGAPYMLEKDVAAYQVNNNLRGGGFYPGRLVTYQSTRPGAHANGYFVPDSIENMMLSAPEHISKGTPQKSIKDYMTPEEVRVMSHGGVFKRDKKAGTNAKYVEMISVETLIQNRANTKNKIKEFMHGVKSLENAVYGANVHIADSVNNNRDV